MKLSKWFHTGSNKNDTQEELEVLNLKDLNKNREYVTNKFEKEDYSCFCHVLGDSDAAK